MQTVNTLGPNKTKAVCNGLTMKLAEVTGSKCCKMLTQHEEAESSNKGSTIPPSAPCNKLYESQFWLCRTWNVGGLGVLYAGAGAGERC